MTSRHSSQASTACRCSAFSCSQGIPKGTKPLVYWSAGDLERTPCAVYPRANLLFCFAASEKQVTIVSVVCPDPGSVKRFTPHRRESLNVNEINA
jgi:hypothetical protein